MSIPDVRGLLLSDRLRAADKIRQLADFRLPELEFVNSDPCPRHDVVVPTCRQCGVVFRKYQRLAIAWTYLRGRALLADEMGLGKGHPLDTEVPTPGGLRLWGDLQVGDQVYGSDGRPTTVTGVFDRGVLDVYEVTLKHGETVTVDGDHLWRVLYGRNREPRVVTTRWLAQQAMKDRHGYRWAVPVMEPVERAGRPLPLNPYVVGALIANGTLAGPGTVLTTPDFEVVTRVRQSTIANDITGTAACPRYSLPGLVPILRDLELRVHSPDKRVPRMYLEAAIEDRVALLQGLMDADGGSRSGRRRSVNYFTTSEGLAHDVCELVTSLAGTASVRSYDRTHEDKPVEFMVNILMPVGAVPLYSGRKAVTPEQRAVKHPRRAIVSVQPRGREFIRCICVDAPDHLYAITRYHILTHNTIMMAGLLGMLKEAGELDARRAVVVARAGNPIIQWRDELARILPKVTVATATGTRKDRIERYLMPWDVMIIGFQMLQHDYEALLQFNVRTLIVDDVDPLRHPDTTTAYVIKRLARQCDRVLICTGTPLQKRLEELHSLLEPIGGVDVLGPFDDFERRFVRFDWRIDYTRSGRRYKKKIITGYQDLDAFKQLIAPLALRRTAAQCTDADMPAVVSQNVFLEMYPHQRTKYTELRKGVLKIIKEEGKKVSRARAGAKFTYGQMICAGLVTLTGEQDGPKTSAKLDWVEHQVVDGDLSEDKVVVFINNRLAVRALRARLDRAKVGNEVIWSEEQRPAVRYAAQQRFWDDPQCRVLIGTTAIEQSLNLQVARHLVNVDTILNPARMAQLAGRIRRVGSAFETVYVHNLLMEDSQEDKYVGLLAREQALIDHVWDEESELFERLAPLALLDLIGKSA